MRKTEGIPSSCGRSRRFPCLLLALVLALSTLPAGMASPTQDAVLPVGDQYLVHDARLYEEMVKGRYYDFWDRSSAWFMTDDIFAYEKTLEAIRTKDGKANALIDALAGRAGQQADTAACIRLLTMLAAMQGVSITQAAETLGDYDDLKTAGSYVRDGIELAWDVAGVFGELPDVASLIGDGALLAADEAGIVHDTVVDGKQLLTGARLYKNCRQFLQTVSDRAASGPMKSAADQLLHAADDCLLTVMRGAAEMTAGMAGTAVKSFPEQFIKAAGDLLQDTDFEKNVGAVLDTAEAGYAKYVAPGMGTAKFAYHLIRLAGNILFDTDDTYYRYIEMQMLSEIADCLTAELEMRGLEPSAQADGIDQAEEAAGLIADLLLVRLRGEYCVKELAVHNGGVLSDLLMVDTEGMEEWFLQRTAQLEDLLTGLNMVLCTGDEVYYYYLEHYLLPEYGWAETAPVTFRVGDLSSDSPHRMPRALAEYKNRTTGDRGTGILSAVIRDFNGDQVNDMLVLMVAEGDISDTPLSDIYRGSRATRLEARLYTMQYNQRPDGYTAPEVSTEGILERSERERYRLMARIFRDWARIYGESWTTRDRFNVYEAYVLDAAEMEADSEGVLLCGICTLDGVPHLYSYETMSDLTAYGPSLFRSWRVEDTAFVPDGAMGTLGWGQKVYASDLDAFFGADDPQIEDTPLETVYGLAAKAASQERSIQEKAMEQLAGSVLCRIAFRIGEKAGIDYRMHYDADDHSRIREGLSEGRSLMGEEPVFVTETSPSQDPAEQILNQLQSVSGLSLSLSSDRAENGSYQAFYETAKGSRINLCLDDQSRVTVLAVYSPTSEEKGEWMRLKDAALQADALGLSPGLVSAFSGACGFGLSSSTEEGDLSTVQIDQCIFMLQRRY